ncbi:MAG: hypothetical protein F6J98_02005 [Moorea sp. SIO4G2]|nr:hypothetical protein [Moorena sp. SIO4G2]
MNSFTKLTAIATLSLVIAGCNTKARGRFGDTPFEWDVRTSGVKIVPSDVIEGWEPKTSSGTICYNPILSDTEGYLKVRPEPSLQSDDEVGQLLPQDLATSSGKVVNNFAEITSPVKGWASIYYLSEVPCNGN